MQKLIFITFISLILSACATNSLSPAKLSVLQAGQRDYEGGYYKRAMHELLPLACEGVPEAEYAVGYMYYYGDGVSQDTDVGYFWIKKSADKHYEPAIHALTIIADEKNKAEALQRKHRESNRGF